MKQRIYFQPWFVMMLLLIWQSIELFGAKRVLDENSWGMTDWLVNYGGGFVRRGLGGEILGGLAGWTGITAYDLAIGVSWLGFSSMLGWFLWRGRRDFPPSLILSCLVMGFPVYQSTVVRKDVLLLLLLLAAVKSIESKWAWWLRWTTVNGMCCVAVLMHETFAFFAFPALILLHSRGIWKESVIRGMGLLPSIGFFLAVVYYHGDADKAEAIHASWMPLWQELQLPQHLLDAPFATIASIGWSSEEGMELTKGILVTGLYQPAAWLGVMVMATLVMARFVRATPGSPPWTRLMTLLAFQLACILPLCLLGVDYGRWLFDWLASSMVFYLCGYGIPRAWLELFTGWQATQWFARWVNRLPKSEWLLLCVGMPSLWNLRNFLASSPVGRLLTQCWTCLN